MEQTVLLVWASCLAVALAGAANSLSGRPVLALAVNSIAATLTLAIFALLEPGVVSQIVQLGGAESSVLMAPVVMWAVLAGAAGIGGIVRRRRKAFRVAVPSRLAHRARWLMAAIDTSESDLDCLATGELRGSGPDGK